MRYDDSCPFRDFSMSTWIDLKYINQISHRLERFSWVRPSKVARCRCPICGDSFTDKTKTRGYFLVNSDVTVFYCQNCNANLPFSKFLEYHFQHEFQEYKMEVFAENRPFQSRTVKQEEFKIDATPVFAPKEFLRQHCVKVGDLPKNHPVNQYLERRRIRFTDLWYTERFGDTVCEFEEVYRSQNIPNEPRLVIPYRNPDGSLNGFQGRALGKSKLRYITIKKETVPDIIFGMDRVNFSKTVFVLEGALDATFIPNSIAVNGSSLQRLNNMFTQEQLEKCVFMFDNEPRNPQIVGNMKKLMEMGHRVVVWCRETPKDVNEMILSGMTMRELVELIRDSIESGLSGLMKLAMWKRC